jgi:hypothetical protein
MLSRELPWIHERLCRVLGGREVLIEVDGERAPVLCDGRRVTVIEAPRSPVVECRTTRRAILDLIEGRMRLDEAVTSERVWLRGGVEDLIAFHDGLMVYLGGAVRSVSFVGLLAELRASVGAAASRA